MKPSRKLIAISIFLLALASQSAFAISKFHHPGVLSSQDALTGLGKRAQSDLAARQGFKQLESSRYSDLSRKPTSYATVKVVASAGNKYEKAFRGDAQAAHATALMWVVTGKRKYREKSMEIMDAWSATFKKLEVSRGSDEQAQLEAAWASPIWTAAAEIIRYYNNGEAGWDTGKIAVFDRFLDKLVKTARLSKDRHNNWATSATLAIMAAAVYQNDRAPTRKPSRCTKNTSLPSAKKAGRSGRITCVIRGTHNTPCALGSRFAKSLGTRATIFTA